MHYAFYICFYDLVYQICCRQIDMAFTSGQSHMDNRIRLELLRTPTPLICVQIPLFVWRI